ncbi:hypothetical protein CERZMDRAFT_90019 [Cercospora zeae-maydis SCOH1-5]|uniref:Uncharacterized protein n=1 Tax=Cercospora zeae-maydis SCOH1-5 TaxID=717836 RepID=A0A6A6FRF8_9PEZI|nr:hypothetical protein CERZMDRAFT_90019 [Cercospora zeae-maydis SCOH1-5]
MTATATTAHPMNYQAEAETTSKHFPEFDFNRAPPRIGFAQLLLPLFIAWISNCQQTSVGVVPTIIARLVQATVLVSLLFFCGEPPSTSLINNGRQTITRFLGFFVQALCVLFVVDLLRLDPTEAKGLVSTSNWRSGTAELFRR